MNGTANGQYNGITNQSLSGIDNGTGYGVANGLYVDVQNKSIVRNGLVLYLDAANRVSYPGSGTVWTDLSGNNNIATLTNGPNFSTLFGGNIEFDGINDFITTGNINLTLTDNITLEFWCKINSYSEVASTAKNLCEFSTNFNLVQTGFVVAYADDSNVAFGGTFPITVSVNGNAGYNISFFPKTLVNDLTWHHWVCVFDKSRTTNETILYIDGMLRNGTLPPALSSNNTNSFGNFPLFFAGRATVANSNVNLSNIKLYNRALTQAEISQNYLATKSRFNL